MMYLQAAVLNTLADTPRASPHAPQDGRGHHAGVAASVEFGQLPPGATQTALTPCIGPARPVKHPFRQGAADEGGLLAHGIHNALA